MSDEKLKVKGPIQLTADEYRQLRSLPADSAKVQAFMEGHGLKSGDEPEVDVDGQTFSIVTDPNDFGTRIEAPGYSLETGITTPKTFVSSAPIANSSPPTPPPMPPVPKPSGSPIPPTI